jgi:hypothetical protein
MADTPRVAERQTGGGPPGRARGATAMLGYASAEIRGYTGQDLELTTGRQEEFAADPYRRTIAVSQTPVTAVTVDVDAVPFTDFTWERYTGAIYRDDFMPWDEGPIVVTYDSGYGPTSDEMITVKLITLEAAGRAIAPPLPAFGAFGPEVGEQRGSSAAVFLTPDEMARLDRLSLVALA